MVLFSVSCQTIGVKPSNKSTKTKSYYDEEKNFRSDYRAIKKSVRLKNKPNKNLPNHNAHKIVREQVQNIPASSEKALYKYIHAAWKSDNYDRVIAGVSLLLIQYPDSQYVDDAQFILSKMDLRRGKLSESLRGVKDFLVKHKNSPLVPNALYLKAEAYREMNLPKISDSIISEIIKKYPKTKIAKRLRAQNLKNK